MLYQYKVKGWLLGIDELDMNNVEVPIIGGEGEGNIPVPESVLALENPVTVINKVVVRVQHGRQASTQYHFFYAHSMHQGVNACIKAVVEESQIQGPALLLRFDSQHKRYKDLSAADWEREDGPARIALKTVALNIQVRPDNDMNPQGRAVGPSIIIVGENGRDVVGFN